MDFFWRFFDQYGLVIILIAIILEYACLPLPSEVILPIAGALCISYNINIFLMILLSVVSGLTGSIFCYYIGYFGYKYILSKSKIYNNFSYSLTSFKKYGNISFCIGRIIPLCRTYISFVAGINKHSLLKFLFYSTIGITIWNTILILLGYNFFNNLNLIIEIYNKYTIIIISIVLIIILVFILIKFFRRQNMKEDKNLKTNVIRLLDQKKIKYNTYTYPHTNEAVSGDVVANLINKDPNTVYKTLVARSSHNKNNYFVFVIPVLENLDLKKAAKAVNEKSVEMIQVKELLSITGYVRGGCSPIGMKKQFITIINDSVNGLSSFIFSAGKIGLQVEIAPEDLSKTIRYQTFDIIEKKL